ncbi:MAG: hypothetical protein K6T17_08435 [Fimbriimonadales bacterium]|nr:hypothetical protein [Fimbriimonadales bacterium]
MPTKHDFKVILVTDDRKIVRVAKEAYRDMAQLLLTSDWREALDWCGNADVLIVDLLATLEQPHKIGGYVKFAQAKMSHMKAKGTPLILIAVPEGYKLNGMVGWPHFVRAYLRRPITASMFQRILTWL